ncbi:IS3 family transposase [Fibrobacter sp. UWH5]|uniref:IS3 family transposase n=1 Tax=Fibrobacter sp. UWH5 TaxID=1896211 RepID=UPI0020C86281|nr:MULTISPECIES: IS3 family transposase [unclassified Fibrobacter]
MFGYSRQAFYKRDDDDFGNEAVESMVLDAAREYRTACPGMGCTKIYRLVAGKLGGTGRVPGRDSFTELLRENGLMVRMRRRRHYRTTYSDHNYRKYKNLIKGVVPSRPNQIWVADITYVETDEGVCYLSLVTDAYSHKIVGWALGPTLETRYPLEALRMALAQVPESSLPFLIHHSDRGCQYCSYEYVGELKKRNIGISMTQSGDPLENAVAERANGILKTEWLYKMKLRTRSECRRELERIIRFYNEERPHMSIGWQTPEKVHSQEGPQRRCWRNPWERRLANKNISLEEDVGLDNDNHIGDSVNQIRDTEGKV